MNQTDTLEKAILCEYDPTCDKNVLSQARKYLEDFKGHPSAWKVCFERVFTSKNDKVHFWCLQTLVIFFKNPEFMHKLDPEKDLKQIHQALLNYLVTIVAKRDLPVFIKNKFSEVIVNAFRIEYSENRWPSFFDDIISCLKLGNSVVDMFLRIMFTIDQEVVSTDVEISKHERKRNTAIKDKMREDCISKVVEVFYTILSGNSPNLIKLTLETMKNYIDWIDINLVTSKFAQLFFKFVGIEGVKGDAIDCIDMMICKGMNLVEKYELLTSLRLVEVVSSIKFVKEEDIEFYRHMSALSNSIGLQLIEVCVGMRSENHRLAEDAYQKMEAFYPYLLNCFSSSMDISSEVIQYFEEYINFISDNTTSLSTPQVQQFGMLLKLIKEKSKFTNKYNHNPSEQDDYEGMVAEYRTDLFGLFKAIARKQKQLALGFLKSIITNMFTHLKTIEFSELEICLQFFYQIGEPILDEIQKDPFCIESYINILQSPISQYKHPAIQNMYFEIISRYTKILSMNPKLIPNVLESFVDDRGMRNPNGIVQSRSTFLFKKLVNSLKSNMYVYAEQLFNYTKVFLEFKESDDFSSEDQMFIYESLGLILSNEKLDPNLRFDIMKRMLIPIFNNMKEIMNKQLYKQDTKENPRFVTLLSRQISALGNVSKGFSATKIAREIIDMFKEMVLLVTMVFKVIPNHPLIREGTIFVVQRMIVLLSDDVIEIFKTIIKDLFNLAKQPEEVSAILVLLNHLMSKTKLKCGEILDEIFIPMVKKIFGLINNGNYEQESTSEESRQQIALHKDYFMFVGNIIINLECKVLNSDRNISQVNNILDTLLQGCKHIQVPIAKICIQNLNGIILKWGTTVNGFNKYVYEKIVPTCFQLLILEHFDVTDALSHSLLKDVCKLLKLILSKYDSEFIQFLGNIFLPSLKWPLEMIKEYVVCLKSENLKPLEDIMTKYINAARSNNK